MYLTRRSQKVPVSSRCKISSVFDETTRIHIKLIKLSYWHWNRSSPADWWTPSLPFIAAGVYKKCRPNSKFLIKLFSLYETVMDESGAQCSWAGTRATKWLNTEPARLRNHFMAGFREPEYKEPAGNETLEQQKSPFDERSTRGESGLFVPTTK